jgi:hypothetical protein
VDTFTDSSGVLLSSHTSGGLQWTSRWGTANIDSNGMAYFSSTPTITRWQVSYGLATCDCPNNATIEGVCKWGDNGYGYGTGYLIFRYVDMDNYMVASSDYVASSCSKFNIVYVQNGVATELASSQSQASCLGGLTGQTGRIFVSFNGSAITARFAANSTSTYNVTLNATSSLFTTATKAGIAVTWPNTRWDNFTISGAQ